MANKTKEAIIDRVDEYFFKEEVPNEPFELVEKSIREFHARVTEIERITDILSGVMSMEPESDFHRGIWALIGGYKDALGAAYGVDGWLEWWWLECGLGNKPMQAGLAGEALRTIATIDDLVQLVRDDLSQSSGSKNVEQ